MVKGGAGRMANIIYLDLNVFSYMQFPREKKKVEDKLFYDTILHLKKRYCFPYSQAHIFDLLKGSNEEYTKKDLSFIGRISDNKIIGEHKETNELIIDVFPPEKCYEISKEITKNKPDTPDINIFTLQFQVDMGQIKSDHFYYDYLISHNGIMESESLIDYLGEKYEEFMHQPQMYKKFRESALTILDTIDTSKLDPNTYELFIALRPMLECLMDMDEKSLEKSFISAVSQFMKASNKEFNKLSKKEQIEFSYHLLAIHPRFQDKIKNNSKNVVNNMVYDSIHLYYASGTKYFVTEDNTLVKKGNFIYSVLGINTRVVLMSELMQKFC